jgi:hypothetical protein
MSRKPIIVLTTSLVLVLLAGVTLFRFYGKDRQPYLVVAPVWSEYSRELKSILVEVLDLEIGDALLAEQNSPARKSQELLFLYTWGNSELSAISDDFMDLTSPFLELLPRAQRRIGQINQGQVALPLVLDHVELAFRRDYFADEGLMVEDRIETLEQAEQVWLSLKSESFFPLMVAGREQQDFLDLVSVLALSQGGFNGYSKLSTELRTSNRASGKLEEFLSMETKALLESVAQRLGFWQSEGILHPEWINFSKADVLRFMETRLTSSVVMRLSTHRTMTPQQLRFWQSSAFPFTAEQYTLRSGGLIAPAMVISARSDLPGSEAALERLPGLLEEPLQDRLGRLTGLAPVNSTVRTVDREADDLRYWAAASGGVLPSIADILMKEKATEFRLLILMQNR